MQPPAFTRADLRLESGAEEEWVATQLDRLDAHIVREGGHDDAGCLQPRREFVGEIVTAPVKSLNGSVPQIEASRVPGTGRTVRRSPYSEQRSGTTTNSSPSGSLSAWTAAAAPAPPGTAPARPRNRAGAPGTARVRPKPQRNPPFPSPVAARTRPSHTKVPDTPLPDTPIPATPPRHPAPCRRAPAGA